MVKKMIMLFFTGLILVSIAACVPEDQNAAHNTGQEARPFSRAADTPNMLSAEATSIPSENFPHTKAVKIQDAVFEFEIDPSQIHLDELYNLDNDILDIESIENELRNTLENALPDRQPDQAPQQPPAADQAPPQHEEAPLARQDTNQQTQQEQPQTGGGPTTGRAPGEVPQQTEPAPEQEAEQPAAEQRQEQAEGLRQEEQRVIELTNDRRRQSGLQELQIDYELSRVARKKSVDMQQNNYFSHTSPTYGSPFDMIRDHGISYNAAGENIAQGQRTPEQVVEAWMNSQGHRENILNPNYTHIGVGYEPNGNHWTQMFISR